ncbi:hypothetical protein FGG08_006022 [Glutinoglossum americanum]|uniref:Uncharacterized protein n=1 Tax=Glutinoglossum americanum TaxID=1670608 RepID=A0A9P8I1S9_9PEZI|nr:hypothetical protein FGG08_006022 [Glutinoglossum americanum]
MAGPGDIKKVVDEVERTPGAAPNKIRENKQRGQPVWRGKESLGGGLDSQEREAQQQLRAEGRFDPAGPSQSPGDRLEAGDEEAGGREPGTPQQDGQSEEEGQEPLPVRPGSAEPSESASPTSGVPEAKSTCSCFPLLSRGLDATRGLLSDEVVGRHDTIAELGIYRFGAEPSAPLKLDVRRILKRFAGPGAQEAWEKEGTITPDVFGFLNQPDLRQMIDHEFATYQHHSSTSEGRPRQGWCRNMYYSLIQQLVRQDPIWYARCAALQGRTDLVAHPYIAKGANVKEKTGFLHLDINVDKYLKSARDGIYLLSSSLSLDGEVVDRRTLVVPGFYRHIKEWWDRASGEGSCGFANNCPTSHHKGDEEIWGKPQPAPYSAFTMRITRPDITHGSTSVAPRRRRTPAAG